MGIFKFTHLKHKSVRKKGSLLQPMNPVSTANDYLKAAFVMEGILSCLIIVMAECLVNMKISVAYFEIESWFQFTRDTAVFSQQELNLQIEIWAFQGNSVDLFFDQAFQANLKLYYRLWKEKFTWQESIKHRQATLKYISKINSVFPFLSKAFGNLVCRYISENGRF